MISTWVRERMKDCFSPMPCLFVGLSVCLSICHLSVCLSTVICPFVICLSICLTVFVHLSSVCLSVCLSICHLSLCLSIHLSSVCLSVCLFICHLSVYPFVNCLSICLACPPVSLCLSVCFLWVHVCKVTLGELYLYCTGWGCGRLTAWPCSSLRWPGDFLAYNQIKKSLASQGKKQCPKYHTSRSQAHLIWTCCDGRLKVRNFLTLFCLSQDI